MSSRLIEVLASSRLADELLAELDGIEERPRVANLRDGQVSVRALLSPDEVDSVVERLEKHRLEDPELCIVILPVEAVLPKRESSERSADASRLGLAELYEDIGRGASGSIVFVALVVLSTVVAAIGLLRDDLAVIIGAMVIAPLLGPNVALALATALADLPLAVRSLKSNALGLSIALALSLAIGGLFEIPEVASIEARTRVSVDDLVLALAAGSASVLAYTSGLASSLVGVMVAVALLPPFVVFGMLLADGDTSGAAGAMLLTMTNVICVNLAGVATLVAQGIEPMSWRLRRRARNTARWAMAGWVLLLLVLLVSIVLFTDGVAGT